MSMVMRSCVVSFCFKKKNNQILDIGNFQVEILIEASLSLTHDNATCDWIALTENRQECCRFERSSGYPCKKPVSSMDGKSNLDNTCSSSSFASCSQLSSVSTIASCSQLPSVRTMEGRSRSTLVYRRRKPQMKSVSVSPVQSSPRLSDGCLSYIGSEAPSKATEEMQIGPEVNMEKESLIFSSDSDNGRFGAKTDLCRANDCYSSSKSSEELGSTSSRAETDENGECSTSGALVVEGLLDNLSERDRCVTILKNQWFADGLWPFKVQSFNEPPGTTTNSGCKRTCKVCEIQERSVEMLICDECDDAFHVSCCNPHVKKMPTDEWFCYFCLKKKHKNLMLLNYSEVSRSEYAISKEELGPIASMLIGIGPYKPGVRIGQGFQADVPDWSGPSFDEVDVIDEPEEIEIGPFERVSLNGQNGSKLSRISSIGNWVQCRQVVKGIGDEVDGTICGKWRRAPLFEVQTDNWECFCSVFWDPAHADCAVPQELDTDQVLKQLKYIETLRPRLAARRRKLDQAKDVDLTENSEDVKKIQGP